MLDKNNSDNLIMLKYIEATLDIQSKKEFEQKLSRSKENTQFVLESQKSLYLMENSSFRKVPKKLFDQLILTSEKKKGEEFDLGKIIIEFWEQGLEVIKNTFTIIEPVKETLAYRKSGYDIETLILRNEELQISFVPLANGKLNLELTFLTSSQGQITLYLKTKNETRMLASFKTKKSKVQFNDLDKGSYTLELLGKKLFLDLSAGNNP